MYTGVIISVAYNSHLILHGAGQQHNKKKPDEYCRLSVTEHLLVWWQWIVYFSHGIAKFFILHDAAWKSLTGSQDDHISQHWYTKDYRLQFIAHLSKIMQVVLPRS